MYGATFKHIIYPFTQWVQGRSTLDYLSYLEQTRTLSRKTIRSIQWKKICKTLELSSHIPLYQRKYSKLNGGNKTVSSWDDFLQLPLLTKDELRKSGTDIVAKDYTGRLIEVRTGGSTGQPLVYKRDPGAVAANLAAGWRCRRWHGIDIEDPYILLWGHYPLLAPNTSSVDKLKKFFQDRLMNRLWLSAYELSELNLQHYLKRIDQFKPTWGIGYASAFFRLANIASRQNWNPSKKLLGIILTSENVYPFQRDLIEKTFRCPTIIEYGATEVGIIAYDCPYKKLHVMDENLYLEIVPNPGLPNGLGEIVITQLANNATPLIRYRTGDIGSVSPKICECGRELSLLSELKGRDVDMLVTAKGKFVHGLYIIHIFDYLNNVREFQVVQQSLTQIDVFIVRDDDNCTVDEVFLNQKLKEQLGDAIQVSIKYPRTIPTEPSGKLRYIKSEVVTPTL